MRLELRPCTDVSRLSHFVQQSRLAKNWTFLTKKHPYDSWVIRCCQMLKEKNGMCIFNGTQAIRFFSSFIDRVTCYCWESTEFCQSRTCCTCHILYLTAQWHFSSQFSKSLLKKDKVFLTKIICAIFHVICSLGPGCLKVE